MAIDIKTILKGSAMGIAEVIPGVSGGTIAFITGIYQTLIDSIKAFDKDLFSLIWARKWEEAWIKINGIFLVQLLTGMVLGIIVGIFGVTWLFDNFPEPLWSFFFGLILISSWIIAKEVKKWSLLQFLLLALGILIAFFIVSASPSEGSSHPLYLFICGVLAISALMLPGISGSFVLLLLGAYTLVISSLKNIIAQQDMESLWIVSFFALGCLVGLLTFSRVLSWLFNKYSEPTYVLLSGFLIGSLYKIWPWRNVERVMDKKSGQIININNIEELNTFDLHKIKIISESHVLPMDYWMSTPKIGLCILGFILGVGIVYILEKSNTKEL